MIEKLLPKGSFRRKIAKKIAIKLGIIHTKSSIEYYNYLNSLSEDQIPLYSPAQKGDTLFSIVVPAFNTPSKYLKPLLASVLSQTYQNWELVIVNASTDELASERIKETAGIDKRIQVIDAPNKGISENTNKGIAAANGDYIAFLDHDDLLDAEALNEVQKSILKYPKAGLIYSDEDKVTDNGKSFFAPHFKPDWSPDLMTNVNYMTHLVVIKKSIINKAGVLNPQKDGAQDYDFLLRVINTGTQIVHIPKVLYHWREADNSTARNLSHKPEATKAGRLAVEEHLKRNNINDAHVTTIHNRPGFYKIIYKPLDKISIIVTPFANEAVLKTYIERLTTRTSCGVTKVKLIVPKGVGLDEKFTEGFGVAAVSAPKESYLKAALEAADDSVVVINKIVLPENKNWLNEFSGLMGLERIAVASPIIIDDTRCVYDAGHVMQHDITVELFKGMKFVDSPTYFGNTEWCRNVEALSGNIVLLRRQELLKFIKENQQEAIDDKKLIHQFSRMMFQEGRDVTVWANVVLNTLTIIGGGENVSSSVNSNKFNPSLEVYGAGFHVVNNEQQVINRLIRMPTKDETQHD